MMKFVTRAREDYMREEGDEDYLLFNPKWKVSASIRWIAREGPCVLTCDAHDHGTKLHMIHPCRWKHNLPARRPDQLCQAVVKPRIVKPVKVSTYCTLSRCSNKMEHSMALILVAIQPMVILIQLLNYLQRQRLGPLQIVLILMHTS